MTIIRMEMGPRIDARDLENLRNHLANLDRGDEITIRVEAHDAELIASALTEHGFNWQPHGSHSGQDYFLTGKKIKRH